MTTNLLQTLDRSVGSRGAVMLNSTPVPAADPVPRWQRAAAESRLSSDEGETEASEDLEKPACHYSPRHPDPMSVRTKIYDPCLSPGLKPVVCWLVRSPSLPRPQASCLLACCLAAPDVTLELLFSVLNVPHYL